MKINISSLSTIQKEAHLFSRNQFNKSINLSSEEQVVDNIDYPVLIKVGYHQSTKKRMLGFLGYLIMMASGVNGNELVESIYIDTIEITDGGSNVTLIQTEKSPYFIVKENDVKYSIERKVARKDYLLLIFFFFLPMLAIFLLLLFLFITSGVEMLLKSVGTTLVVLLIVFILYQMYSLYKKTK